MATPMGFEPTTSCVTGKRSSLLNYGAIYSLRCSVLDAGHTVYDY